MDEAHNAGKQEKESEGVDEASRERIQYEKQLRIIELFGTIDYDEDYDYKEQRRSK